MYEGDYVMTSTNLTFTVLVCLAPEYSSSFVIKKCFKNETFPLAEGRFVEFIASS